MGLYLIIMGVQGAGKGMQAGIVSQHYGIPHISTGDLFRAMRSREDALAKKIQDIMKSGALVSDDDTNEVLLDRLQQDDAQGGVILDGYPRNIAQAQWLEMHLAEKGEKLGGVLLLELDLYTAFKRAFGRVSAADGASYNIYYNSEGVDWAFVDHPEKAYPPQLQATLNVTGEVLKRRPDDANAHAVLKRIDTFMESTAPLIDHYAAKDLLVRINADQSIAAVTTDIKQAVDALT